MPQNSPIDARIADYPSHAKKRFATVRQLLHDTALTCGSQPVEESLKWSEPSFGSRNGSPVRMAWKQASPDTLSLYFNCNTKLVATFREVLPDEFEYHGNRELRLPLTGVLPERALIRVFAAALQYKQLKHLPLLGM